MQKFLQGRIDLVRSLIDNRLASYADLVLIICAVLSACASRRWRRPSKRRNGHDRGSFIELLVKYSPDDFRTSWVSIPSLINDNLIDESQTPYGNPGNTIRIYCDDEIDLSLEDAIRKYPRVLSKNLRQHCYASLIYERLRCGYVHEYCPHVTITPARPTHREARISYIGRSSGDTIRRMISFHLDYLISLAEYPVFNLPNSSSECPSPWWIDEKK
jgi:hypothetical protein